MFIMCDKYMLLNEHKNINTHPLYMNKEINVWMYIERKLFIVRTQTHILFSTGISDFTKVPFRPVEKIIAIILI